MRKIIYTSFILSLIICFSGPVTLHAKTHNPASVEFLQDIRDMPLAPQLTEVIEKSIVFDNPTGRIIFSHAEGDTSPAKISQFYRTTLPQLGWVKRNGLSFQRGDERLSIEITQKSGKTYVTFQLKPEA